MALPRVPPKSADVALAPHGTPSFAPLPEQPRWKGAPGQLLLLERILAQDAGWELPEVLEREPTLLFLPAPK